MNRANVKRSVVIRGHKTSVSMEGPFWKELKGIAAAFSARLCDVIATVQDNMDGTTNLSSAIRLYVLDYTCGRKVPRPIKPDGAQRGQEERQPRSN